jgi:type II secretory pathway component GspD/PulD (secretin)
MKSTLAVALIGLVASSLAYAQNPPAGDTAAPPAPAPVAAAGNAVIPFIQFQETALTAAIDNLARTAGLNYILDPKVGFGQPDEQGKVRPQPNITLRWENLTAEQALSALLNNYNLQIVDDPKTKIARVTVKDPAAPDPLETKIYQLSYANPSNLVSAVQASLLDKRSKVIGDNRTSQLVVVATAKELESVNTLIVRLDQPTKQVLIEARLLETSDNPKTSKGIDWSGTLQAQTIKGGNNLQTKPVTDGESVNKPLATEWPKMMLDTAKGLNPSTFFLDADGVSAVLSYLNTSSDAKVLSTPRTVTLDNEMATISVIRASPIINVTPGTANTTGGSEITYTNMGVILSVTPRISANNMINLKVVPEVSRIFDRVNTVVGDGVFQADRYDIRKLETRVMIPSGNTLVLGGLIQDDQRNSGTKIPILGDIPGLGRAFRSDSKSREKSNLIIFITPTIVRDEDFQPTKTDFLKTPVAEASSDEAWGAYDSAKPLDWSKPVADQYKGKSAVAK